MKTLLAQLNFVAREYQDEGMEALDALNEVANVCHLNEVVENDQCRIYKAADGTLINAWIGGNLMSDTIDEGGLGFDDQVEWFVNDLITQAEAADIMAGLTGLKRLVQTIQGAIKDGRLRGYNNPDAEYQRQGATLVSENEVRELWG